MSILLQAAKKKSGTNVPVEMYPLFLCVGVACGSLAFFTYRHFAFDEQLRLWKNPNLSSLDDVLNKAVTEEKKED
ncbi:uncharacterized protein KQ657_002440 [Scheffersomyces spartinae]|uniref:Uncharacterized protein n=1 Tax=Scheffersomyces spartinae TaxID=45513 RepID=A0A9P7V708_9ASCO|nr:uncharacterized protein KQ657_002440 [Scheffersomyces spartinae]KAG7192080.1 hypothetical protein KQ657_002440 [Scheffersomyces spartinae]